MDTAITNTDSAEFLAIAKRVLTKHTGLQGEELDAEAQSLAYALSATANNRIGENR